MTMQFLRHVSLTTFGSGGLTINPKGSKGHQQKIEFSVRKDLTGEQNEGEVKVWNLSGASRNAVGKEGDDLLLEAGYTPPFGGSNVGVIALGQIRDVKHSRSGADIITTIEFAEGDKAFRKSSISKTFSKGTEIPAIVEELYAALEAQGIEKGEWIFPEDLEPLKRAYSMLGSPVRELDRLGRGFNFYWSIQSGVLEIIPADGFINARVLLNKETGLIDVPSITDTGIECSALLNPEIRPNRQVTIESSILELNSAGGNYRVAEVEYTGDNEDGEFRANIVGEAINDEGKVVEE